MLSKNHKVLSYIVYCSLNVKPELIKWFFRHSRSVIVCIHFHENMLPLGLLRLYMTQITMTCKTLSIPKIAVPFPANHIPKIITALIV